MCIRDRKKGEVLGFAGLVGAGRSELMNAVFGVSKKTSGSLEMDGKPLEIHGVKAVSYTHLPYT